MKQHTQRTRNSFLLLCICLLLAAMLGGCGEEEDALSSQEPTIDLPANYTVGDEEIAAVAPGEEIKVEGLDTAQQYVYLGVSDAKALAESYALRLTTGREPKKEEEVTSAAEDTSSAPEEEEEPDRPFYPVDETYTRISLPDFTADTGSLLLARVIKQEKEEKEEESAVAAEEEKDRLVVVRLDWTVGQCTVTVGEKEGKILKPASQDNGFGSAAPMISMSEEEAIDYVYSQDPKTLGLNGGSMEEYNVYVMPGNAFLNGQSCIRVKICHKNNEGTNDIAGIYLMGPSGEFYRVDEKSGDLVGPLSMEK